MTLDWQMVAWVAAAVVAANQIIGALRDAGERRFRQGRHVQEDTAAVQRVSERLEDHLRIVAPKMNEFEEVKAITLGTARDVAHLTKQVDRLVGLQDDTNRSLRTLATAMGVRIGADTPT